MPLTKYASLVAAIRAHSAPVATEAGPMPLAEALLTGALNPATGRTFGLVTVAGLVGGPITAPTWQNALRHLAQTAGAPAAASLPNLPDQELAEAFSLPEADELDCSEELALDVDGPVLVLSDTHIPHHDLAALTAVINEGVRRGVKHVVLLGDIADFYAASAWERDPSRRDLMAEIKSLREFFGYMRYRFRGIGITYKLGNHEERFFRYLSDKAPELFGLDVLAIDNLLGLNRLGGVRTVDRMQYVTLGGADKITLVHGHEFGKGAFNPVNAARGLYLRAKESAMCGHWHQPSAHTERTIRGRVIETYGLGCLCNLRAGYAPHNAWRHGAAVVTPTAAGFHVEALRVVDGTVV